MSACPRRSKNRVAIPCRKRKPRPGLTNDPPGRSAMFTELAPTDSRFPKPTPWRSKRALRRLNLDLVNLASLPANVHDFLHRAISYPTGTGQKSHEMSIFAGGVNFNTMFVAEQYRPP